MELRPLTRDDLPLLAGWLAEPLVARWWHQAFTPEALEEEFGAALDGREPTELLLASHHGRLVGFVQRYPIHAYPEYVEELTPLLPVPGEAWSIDYLVGEPSARGRGLAALMIREAIRSLPLVIVPVHADNVASWRSLEHAGFARVARGRLEPDNPADSADHVVYQR